MKTYSYLIISKKGNQSQPTGYVGQRIHYPDFHCYHYIYILLATHEYLMLIKKILYLTTHDYFTNGDEYSQL